MRDTPSLQPQTPTRSVSAGRWSRATARARAVSRVRRGLAPGDAAASPAQEPAATLTGVQSAQGDGGSRNDVHHGASPARSSTPPRLQAAVRKVRAANSLAGKDHDEPQFTELWDESSGRAYFVNKKTGATSWRRPAGLRSP